MSFLKSTDPSLRALSLDKSSGSLSRNHLYSTQTLDKKEYEPKSSTLARNTSPEYVPQLVYEVPKRQLILTTKKANVREFDGLETSQQRETNAINQILQAESDEPKSGVIMLHESLMNMTRTTELARIDKEEKIEEAKIKPDPFEQIEPRIQSIRNEKELQKYGLIEPDYKYKLHQDNETEIRGAKKKTIYDIKKKTDDELAAGNVRGELMENDEVYAEDQRVREGRFKELSADWKSTGRYRTKSYDIKLGDNPYL